MALLLACVTSAFAKTGYASALDDIAEGRYELAVGFLAEHVAAEPSPEAYLNLALAYRGHRKPAQATLALLTAESLGAHGKALKEVRKAVYAPIPAELRPLSVGPLKGLARTINSVLPANGAALGAMALLAVGLILLVLIISGAVNGQGGTLTSATAISLLGAALFFWLALMECRQRNTDWAAVTGATGLHASPSVQSERIRGLPKGTPIELGERVSDTYFVTLPTGTSGWVPAGSVQRMSGVGE